MDATTTSEAIGPGIVTDRADDLVAQEPDRAGRPSSPVHGIRHRLKIDASLILVWALGVAAVGGLLFYAYTNIADMIAPQSRGIVVIDVGQIEAPYFTLIREDTEANSRALGQAIGQAIRADADQYAAAGYTVINGDAVLAYPGHRNVTARVRAEVARQLTKEDPAWSLTPMSLTPGLPDLRGGGPDSRLPAATQRSADPPPVRPGGSQPAVPDPAGGGA
jgi:hypothetical protein